jgi:hypothetical protein
MLESYPASLLKEDALTKVLFVPKIMHEWTPDVFLHK